MNALAVAQRYFDAWIHRDADGIVDIFTEDGTYSDPTAGDCISREATSAYAKGLWDAFPDLTFEIISNAETGVDTVAAQWSMRGTNTGSLQGLPPTGRLVVIPGADFIRVEGDKIRSVRGYFDSRAVPDQLGLQVVVQPNAIGPFAFGTSAMVQTGSNVKPGAFSVTMLQARSDDEVQQLSALSQEIVQEMLGMKGFISWMGTKVGHRMTTVTAWETPEDHRQLHSGGTHPEAVRKFRGPDLAAGGMTSVWSSGRFNTYVRCLVCGQMVHLETAEGKCLCGEALPEPLPYW
ncbi:MAG: ester cyclase [Terrimicrobiaceae bacterium]